MLLSQTWLWPYFPRPIYIERLPYLYRKTPFWTLQASLITQVFKQKFITQGLLPKLPTSCWIQRTQRQLVTKISTWQEWCRSYSRWYASCMASKVSLTDFLNCKTENADSVVNMCEVVAQGDWFAGVHIWPCIETGMGSWLGSHHWIWVHWPRVLWCIHCSGFRSHLHWGQLPVQSWLDIGSNLYN